MSNIARLSIYTPFTIANLAVVAALLLSGCSTTGGSDFRIHSPERDKQGQALKDAWSKVDLKSQIDIPRQNLAKTLTEQLATEEEIWSKRRSIVAAQMARDWTVAKFQSQAEAGLKRVVGPVAAGETPASAAKKYREFSATIKTESDGRDHEARRILALGLSAPTCGIVTGDTAKRLKYLNEQVGNLPADKADQASAYAGLVSTMTSHCNAIQVAKDGQAKLIDTTLANGGDLGKAIATLKAEEASLEADKTAAELAAASLKGIQATYENAEKDFLRTKGAEDQKRVEDAIAKLKNWETDTKALEGKPIFGKLLSQIRLESLDKFLATYTAASTGKGTPEGSNRLAVALALIPDMEKKSDEALTKADRPNLTPFVLRKNIEQARSDAASRDVERVAAIVDLRKKIVAALEDQLEAYEGAYSASSQVAQKAKVKKDGKESEVEVRWAEALQAVEAKPNTTIPEEQLNPKIAAWRASTRFLEAEGRLRADIGQSYYRIYALQYEGVLLYAESSIQQWKGLVDPSVDLLSQWGAAGVVPQDVIQLFNSLMLLGVAVGVN